MAGPDHRATFTSALNTTNAALEKHADRTPFKQILAAADRVLADHKLGIAVYADDPEHPHDYFTVRYSNGSFELVSHGKDDPDVAASVSLDYLEEVAQNPQRYIDNPLKLDLDWLTSRLDLD